MLTRRMMLASAALVPLASAAVAMPASPQVAQTYIKVVRFDHFTAFTLVKDGKCAFAQFRTDDVPDPVGGVWDIKDGAQAFHTSVRNANTDEMITLGAKLMPELYALLDDLITDALRAKAA